MKSTFKFIIGLIVLILISVHIIVIGLIICPIPKLLNLALASDIEYISISDTPEHVRQVFSDDRLMDLTENNSPIRKIASKVLTIRQNKFFDNNERQELYLNTLDFGGDIIGVEAASNYYFKKPVSDLSFEESLTLAGLYKIFK